MGIDYEQQSSVTEKYIMYIRTGIRSGGKKDGAVSENAMQEETLFSGEDC